MNSGCYGNEISNNLISVKTLDLNGNLKNISRDKINFVYRGSNLSKDIIILSAKFHAKVIKVRLRKKNQKVVNLSKKRSTT